ncbi:MAG: hypothetical protein A2Z15_02055 [Chloroflexi bacterium RBG_16_50_11]|nr:MAG: hypothetical protein A2Z15_02055 [Chloroflexi bacterium RBG_16_50_11]
MNKLATSWWESSATFKRGTWEKASFIFLCALDLMLTLMALNLGLSEINPLVRYLVQIPALLLTVKLFIPVIIAWILPSKLLWPSIALLAAVVIWNLKEMVIFLL